MHLVKGQIFVRTIYFFIPAAFVIIGFSVVISHRVAGPLYRIKRMIDDVIRGEDVEYIRLRKKDEHELKDLATKISDLITMIRKSRESSN